MKTTNYINTFIEAAADSPAASGEMPPQKGTRQTVATIQYDLMAADPYKYNSDDIIFRVYQLKNVGKALLSKEEFFEKGQPCFRSSPLTKRYGWGIHNNEEGKIAMYAVESEEYKKLAADPSLKHVKAMRSKKA